MDETKKGQASAPAISIGVSEWIYLLGVFGLGAGVALQFGAAWALIVVGVVLLFTAFRNDAQRTKEIK